MDMLLRGLVVGFSIAAPVGQIGVLCIRRTLSDGRVPGLVSGLGAATADACYGFVAAFGLTFVADMLTHPTALTTIHLLGAAFLFYLGLKIMRAAPASIDTPRETSRRGLLGVYGSTFLLTLTNPTTILMYMGVFAGLRIGVSTGDYGSAALMVAGVFVGSAAWWLILSSGVSLLRSRFNTGMLRAVNVLSGLIIIGFGAFSLLTLQV